MNPAVRRRVEAVLGRLRGYRIHVLGPSGTEGAAVVDFLLRGGVSSITAHDLEPAERFAVAVDRTHRWLDPEGRAALVRRLTDGPITWRRGTDYLRGIEEAEFIFVPQSWFRYAQNDPVRQLAARGVPLSSMMQLFFEVHPGPIVGVTGTNGKFTVATLIAQMIEASGLPVVTSGNDRTHVPVLYHLDRLSARTWLVLEISNRQLLGLSCSPHVAVVTNLAPHHLDDHGSMEAYVEVKRTILRHQSPQDFAVLNADDPRVAAMATGAVGAVRWFSRTMPVAAGACVQEGMIVLAGRERAAVMPAADLTVPGAHMLENATAAATASAIAGVPAQVMARVLRGFRGLPYRLRFVTERGGVAFYEDSLATNPAAAAAAVASMTRPFHLIAGGLRRNARPEDFAPMARALAAASVKGIYLIGATAAIMADAFGALRHVRVTQAGTLPSAVASACEAASPGDAILLSPGCESFDQFADYRDRGDRFCALAHDAPVIARERTGA